MAGSVARKEDQAGDHHIADEDAPEQVRPCPETVGDEAWKDHQCPRECDTCDHGEARIAGALDCTVVDDEESVEEQVGCDVFEEIGG